MNNILVIGTGELGSAIISSLHQHSVITSSPHKYSITATIRPSTLISPTSTIKAKIQQLQSKGVAILALDIETTTLEDLTPAFTNFNTIIHAGGMTIAPGTQLKVTQAVLASASSDEPSPFPKLYIPWQFGLDYDAIGPESGDGLFAEQCQVRGLLRSQNQVQWVIVSNGIFTSFMFEPAWGLVEPSLDSNREGEIVVRALGDWDARLAYTTAEDIARCTVELILVDTDLRGMSVYIAGDVLSYREFAEIIGKVYGKDVRKELLTVEELEEKMRVAPENKLRKYHVVFSKHVGTAWDTHTMYNIQKSMGMVGVEEYLRKKLCDE